MESPVDTHKPFIAASEKIPEIGIAPIITGAVLGILFGASSLYLALKVGMTVSASIPVAVLSITLFRLFQKAFGWRKATILENNIVQTTGSAGESIAFGVAVTMPALMILGFEMDLTRVMLVSTLGGLLGVLMMIPLRRALIVKAHKELAYPEGTACAQVLIAGEKGGMSAKTVFTGFFLGFFYKIFNLGFKLWAEIPNTAFRFFKGASLSAEVSPELLGVGFIIGPRVASITFAGGVLSWWVLIPAIRMFGDALTAPVFPASKLISEMSLHEVWRSYVLYIGAGAVAAGGIISLFRGLPTIWRGAMAGFSALKGVAGGIGPERIDQDIPMPYVLGGIVLLIVAITLAPPLGMNVLGAILIIAFGFLFSTVSSRLTGEIGSSSNPISGMTVATLLLTSLIFLGMGWTTPHDRILALSVAAIVCIAASNAGTTSQDLKTGYLVGGTPKYQQIGILVGALTSAIFIGYTLDLLNRACTIYSVNVPENARIADVASLTDMEQVQQQPSDQGMYHVLRTSEPMTLPSQAVLQPGKYLVDDTGLVKYLVDPGINGVLNKRDDGTPVQKYEAPKARLMSLIIDGILTQKLSWGLVLLGVAIALFMELCGVSSLPFAVGVYLPLSTTAPIFVGGVVRWLCEGYSKRRGVVNQTEEERESGPGILFSSGLIAGGSIAGIGLALLSLSGNIATTLDFSRFLGGFKDSNIIATGIFFVMAVILFKVATSHLNKPKH